MNKKTFNNYINLFINLVLILSTVITVVGAYFTGTSGNMEGIGVKAFNYFTIDSNIFLGIVCLIYLPVNLIKLKNVDYKVPKWIAILRLSATLCITVTFLTVVAFLGPVVGYMPMIVQENFVLHISSPILALVSYLLFEEKDELSFAQSLLSLIPVAIYGAVYIVMVVVIGSANGGWGDFYHFNVNGMWYITLTIFVAFGLLLDFVLYKLNKCNMFTKDGGNYNFKIKHKPIENEADIEYFKTHKLSALDAYVDKVFVTVCTVSPLIALCAGLTFTLCKLVGWYPDVSWEVMSIFDATCVLYFVVAIFFISFSFYENGSVIPSRLKLGKVVFTIVILIQWNFISYMIPSKDFWGYAFLFIIIASFFFDYKLTDSVSILLLASIIVSWIIKKEALIPSYNVLFYPNMILRILCYVLTATTLHFFTYFGGKVLATELENRTEKDTLTNLYNRLHLNKYLEEAYNNALFGVNNMTLALIDIDDFKLVNDSYGHESGDIVLQDISEIISSFLNEGEKAFRWGGEEILVLLLDDAESSYQRLNDLKNNIANSPLDIEGEKLYISITIGISTFEKEKPLKEMFREADMKNYHGKKNGKNIVIK